MAGAGHIEFDRAVTFTEVFCSQEGTEMSKWLYDLLEQDTLVLGRDGASITIPRASSKAMQLPKPKDNLLPATPTRFSRNGSSSVGIPVLYEGETFALLIFDDAVRQNKALWNKLNSASKMIEWYTYIIHQRRMISELQHQTQTMSYDDLLREHEKVVQSEAQYRELSETLELKVEERKKELVKAQRQLLQHEKMASIGQLAAGVAHEINNPVGFVYSNLQTLEKYHETIVEMLEVIKRMVDRADGPGKNYFTKKWKEYKIDLILDDLPELVKESLKGTERITRIVRGLSRFSHVDESVVENININDLLDSTVELLWNEIKYKAELARDYDVLPIIRGNSNQLGQVFVNLMMNAVQSLEKDGKITLRTKANDGDVEIQVVDNGCGIENGHISEIFNPFFTTKPVGQGTGLGLSISYEIVRAHQGEIRVESEEGKGTTFTVYLPAEQPTP